MSKSSVEATKLYVTAASLEDTGISGDILVLADLLLVRSDDAGGEEKTEDQRNEATGHGSSAVLLPHSLEHTSVLRRSGVVIGNIFDGA